MKTQRPPQTESSPDSDAYRALLDSLSVAIVPLQTIHQQAVESLATGVREINPQATASYISAYREMWDSNDQETKEAEFSDDLPNGPEVKP